MILQSPQVQASLREQAEKTLQLYRDRAKESPDTQLKRVNYLREVLKANRERRKGVPSTTRYGSTSYKSFARKLIRIT